MGVPPVIIHLVGLSIINHPFWGTPMTMETIHIIQKITMKTIIKHYEKLP